MKVAIIPTIELKIIQLRFLTSSFKVFHDFSGHSSKFYSSLASLVGNTKLRKDGYPFNDRRFINVAKQTRKVIFVEVINFTICQPDQFTHSLIDLGVL